jgi:hypothetical protein
VVRYYSPAGILVRNRDYSNRTVYEEDEYDASNGLTRSENTFINGELRIVIKMTYDDSGEILRGDIYSQNVLWYGSFEFADDLLMVKKYKWPGGRIADVRFSYDDKRQPKEVTVYFNDQLVCVLKYDRFPTGAIKRTIALGANGQVFAVYPGLEVDEVDQQGHPLYHPDVGTIYRQGNWWGVPMPSFGRGDGDGAMP